MTMKMMKWPHLLFLSPLQRLHDLTELFFFLTGLGDAGLLLLSRRHGKHRHDEAEEAETAGEDDEHEEGQVDLTCCS